MVSRRDTERPLPPLGMLRAFEAAARHGSMSRAAKELHVTHSAVSRQVTALERVLQSRLFRRRARGIQLTDDGTRLFHGISAGFDRMRVTIADLRHDRQQRAVTITTLPTLASRWLLPRVVEFQERHTRTLVNIRTGTQLDDLGDPSIDFAIRYGSGNWANTTSTLLLSTTAYPVCSPGFLRKHGRPRNPAELLRTPLIHDVTRQWWLDWLVAAGAPVQALQGGTVVDDYGLALQFALDGHGVALARHPLVDRDLNSGALVRLFDIDVVPPFAYYIVTDRARKLQPPARTLVQWLLRDASESTQ